MSKNKRRDSMVMVAISGGVLSIGMLFLIAAIWQGFTGYFSRTDYLFITFAIILVGSILFVWAWNIYPEGEDGNEAQQKERQTQAHSAGNK